MNSCVKLSFTQKITLELLWLLSKSVAILPHWFRYRILARGVYFIVYTLLRYRLAVVRENLSNAFPEKSEAERDKIARDFYVVLSEMVISTLSLARKDPENSTIVLEQGDDVSVYFASWELHFSNRIALTAHFGLWEYLLFAGKHFNRKAAAVYHALENPIFEELFKRLRSHKNVILLPITEASRFCVKHRDGVDGMYYTLGLISDQAPPRRAKAKWYKFLNQDTQFYDGGEKLALRLGLPVVFVYQQRISAGRYQFIIEPIYGGHEQIEEGAITNQYVKRLEHIIRENPHMWLWSHRRWKRKRLDNE